MRRDKRNHLCYNEQGSVMWALDAYGILKFMPVRIYPLVPSNLFLIGLMMLWERIFLVL